MIAPIGSTSSIGMGPAAGRSLSRPRSVPSFSDCSSTAAVYSLKMPYCFERVACWSLNAGPGVEEVELGLASPLVLAADLELAVGQLGRPWLVGPPVPRGPPRPPARTRPTPLMREEVPVKYSSISASVEADGLERLGARVGRHRRNAHLRHHLQDALAGRLACCIRTDLPGRDALQQPFRDHVVDGSRGPNPG